MGLGGKVWKQRAGALGSIGLLALGLCIGGCRSQEADEATVNAPGDPKTRNLSPQQQREYEEAMKQRGKEESGTVSGPPGMAPPGAPGAPGGGAPGAPGGATPSPPPGAP